MVRTGSCASILARGHDDCDALSVGHDPEPFALGGFVLADVVAGAFEERDALDLGGSVGCVRRAVTRVFFDEGPTVLA